MSNFSVVETVSDKIEEFIDCKRAMGISPETIKTYRNHFKAIKIPEGNIDAVNWKMTIQSIWGRDIAEYSKVSYLKTLKAFMNWLGIKDLPRIPTILKLRPTQSICAYFS